MSTRVIATIMACLFIILTMIMYVATGEDAMQGLGNIILALILQQVVLSRAC